MRAESYIALYLWWYTEDILTAEGYFADKYLESEEILEFSRRRWIFRELEPWECALKLLATHS